MKVATLVPLVCFCLMPYVSNAQIALDSCGRDSSALLNWHEVKVLDSLFFPSQASPNYHRLRNGYQLRDINILFYSCLKDNGDGSGIMSKPEFFGAATYAFKGHAGRGIIELNYKEKAESGGYDAVIVLDCKAVFPETRSKIIELAAKYAVGKKLKVYYEQAAWEFYYDVMLKNREFKRKPEVCVFPRFVEKDGGSYGAGLMLDKDCARELGFDLAKEPAQSASGMNRFMSYAYTDRFRKLDFNCFPTGNPWIIVNYAFSNKVDQHIVTIAEGDKKLVTLYHFSLTDAGLVQKWCKKEKTTDDFYKGL